MVHHDIALLDAPFETAAGAGRAADYDATDRDACRQLTLGLVHEMNNLLGGIAVLSEIYQQENGADDGLNEGLALIHKSTGRLQTLVGHLRVLNGPPTEAPAYLNLSETVRTFFELVAPLLPKTWAVEMPVPPEELAVYVDETLFRRVLLNLTLNLRDASDHPNGGPGRFQVALRRRPGDSMVDLTLSVGTAGRQGERPLTPGAQARHADARRCLQTMDGTLIANENGGVVLSLPLVA